MFRTRYVLFWLCFVAAPSAFGAQAQPADANAPVRAAATPRHPAKPHRAKTAPQVGKASIYARKFAGRKMSNGRRMDPAGDNAASTTLPLGTIARVTNLETGKSATVTIEDRGPYVAGRIVDLSPATAEKIGLEQKQGVAPVEVAPITVPPPSPEGSR